MGGEEDVGRAVSERLEDPRRGASPGSWNSLPHLGRPERAVNSVGDGRRLARVMGSEDVDGGEKLRVSCYLCGHLPANVAVHDASGLEATVVERSTQRLGPRRVWAALVPLCRQGLSWRGGWRGGWRG